MKKDQELKELFKSVRKILVKKGLLKKETSPKQKEKPRIFKEPKERRRSRRLILTKDFNRSIILRINPLNTSENIKSFANNISCGGLCFDSQREFENNSKLNLRLFFYGGRFPMVKIQGRIIWKRKEEVFNYYGFSFSAIKNQDKIALEHYIDSGIKKEVRDGCKICL